MFKFCSFLGLLGLFLGLAGPGPALAQEERSAETLSPPQLIAQPAVSYPEAALREGVGAQVVVQVDLDAEGRVIAVQVAEPPESGPYSTVFEASAVQAVYRFQFEPARNEAGEGVPSRILYRYVFAAERQALLAITGVLKDPVSEQGLGERQVFASRGEQTESVVSEFDGSFSFFDLESGEWVLTVEGQEARVPVTVSSGSVSEVEFYVDQAAVGRQETGFEELVVEARLPTTSVTERVLSREEISFLPGAGGDVVKVVQNLPGVGRSPLGTGNLIIRGTSPEDSGYFLDGGNIPVVFHFGGLTTVVASDTLSEVAFLPGSFSVRYGRILGGLVDLRSTTVLPAASRSYVSVDIYQATAFSEHRIGDRNAVSIAGRRSYADAVLNPILNDGNRRIQAPRYYDFQARWMHKTDSNGLLDAFFFLSDDSFRFLGPEDEGSIVQSAFGTSFQKLRVQFTQPMEKDWRFEATVLGGPQSKEFQFDGDGEAYERPFLPTTRLEFFRPDKNGPGWRFGLDLLAGVDRYLYDVPNFGTREEGESVIIAPGLYAESTLNWGPSQWVLGLRGDAMSYEDGLVGPVVDPRLGLKVDLWEGGRFIGGVGKHSQFPLTRQLLSEGEGVPGLEAAYSLQSSFGLEQVFGDALSIETVGFFQRLNNLVSGREETFRFFTGPPDFGPFDTGAYANDGTGLVCGVETLIRMDLPNTVAFLSATFSHSERQDRPDDDRELFRYDQPVVLTAVGSHDFGNGWRLGSRVRFSSGYPYTPVVNSFYDLQTREFVPVFGERSSARLPNFFSVDLRIDKEYEFQRWVLTTYLDIQNLTNTTNAEVIAWTYDYEQEEGIESNPLFPAFGLKGEW
ncbi:MAG: TonB family protein [Myxococcota bacterium]|nr:TonB family protein [Myxococcota bacterium]